jgi:peptide chain release factor 2
MKEIKENLKTLSERLEKAFLILNLEEDRKLLKSLEEKSQAADFWDNSTDAGEIMQEIGGLNNKIKIWDDLTNSLNNLIELSEITDENDHETTREIEIELDRINEEFEKHEFELLFNGKYDKNSAIISISAGSGGTDAQDWAEMLLRMYLKFAEKSSFSTKILHQTPGEEAGIKSATLEIKSPYAYGYLKSEHGVHRLVRISPFDGDKARHTSFALIEVTPELETKDFELDEKDLRIDTFRSGGHGGQSVNTTDSAVRIVHLPTGMTATCQNERSQIQNREMAMNVLKAKLFAQKEAEEAIELAKIKGENISAEWGNQIRSYVMQPYTLVKDHRNNFETSDVNKVLDGNIDEFIEAFLRS